MSKLYFISLGCPKNRVDAENMLGIALQNGHELVQNPEDSDTILVNTCSFIGEAKKESIDAILQMGELKQKMGQKLIVTGCLAQRYGSELEGEMPEVDHFLGTSDFAQIGQLLPSQQKSNGFVNILKKPRNLVTHELEYLAKYDLPRVNSMPKYTAYLKVSEGCDNKCAFCIIPKLRGKQRSRTIEDLVKEAQELAKTGVFELNLIAQDLTAYGHDIPGRPTLAMLLKALQQVEGIRWVRCLYAYPRSLSDDLMDTLASGGNILPYFDIPTQHGSDRMLRLMRRGKDSEKLTELLLRLRKKVPGLVLRSTVIVGFPGETEEDFEELMQFAKDIRFERLGVFQYSDEEGTSAFDYTEKLPAATKRSRYQKLMREQKRIHKERLKEMVGQVHEAVVEGVSPEHPLLVKGRLWSQAPDIDGITYLSSERPLVEGERVFVKVRKVLDYDLVADVLEPEEPAILHALPFRVGA